MVFKTYWHPHAGGTEQVLTPQEVAALYSTVPNSGAAMTIGIVALDGGYSNNDLTAAGINPSRVSLISIDGGTNTYTGDPNSADVELALDLQVIGLAFAGKMKVFHGQNTFASYKNCIQAAANDPDICAISSSWGSAESGVDAADELAFRQVITTSRVAGKPVFVASGDSGRDDNTGVPIADFPCCAEDAIACGGSTLIPTTAGGTTIGSESNWDDSKVGGGEEGYGYSKVVPAPTWQGGVGFRRVPDVVLDAEPSTCYIIHLNSQQLVIGGTSAAAPMHAALFARLLEALGSAPANYAASLYAAGSAVFNTVAIAAGDPPYCVGLGSPNMTKIAAALSTPTTVPPVVVTPPPAHTWPQAGLVLSPFLSGIMTNAAEYLDPAQPSGSLLAYVLAHPDRFVNSAGDAIFFTWVQKNPNYVLQALATANAQGGTWETFFDNEQAG